jgi:uncharacterized protein (TIGR02186 family)
VIAGLALVLGLALLASPSARAERLVISVSTHRVLIASNFTGVDLTLFGAVETDAASVGRVGGYAIVTTVTGPPQTVAAWRKERLFGIWINRSSRTFLDPPSYLAVLSSRPLDAVASPEVLRHWQVGLRQFVLPQEIGGDIADVLPADPFRQAFVRLKTEQQLYREQGNAVSFLTPTLFRSAIPLPATVPVGTYEVDVKLFADGVMIARDKTAFELIKTGFEQYVATAARDHGLLYGLATAALALLAGWLGSVVFRRD